MEAKSLVSKKLRYAVRAIQPLVNHSLKIKGAVHKSLPFPSPAAQAAELKGILKILNPDSLVIALPAFQRTAANHFKIRKGFQSFDNIPKNPDLSRKRLGNRGKDDVGVSWNPILKTVKPLDQAKIKLFLSHHKITAEPSLEGPERLHPEDLPLKLRLPPAISHNRWHSTLKQEPVAKRYHQNSEAL